MIKDDFTIWIKDIQNKIRESEKTKKISEDYSKRLQDLLQKITDKYIILN